MGMLETLYLVSWREPLWFLLLFVPMLVWAWRKLFRQSESSFADKALLPWITYRERSSVRRKLFSKDSAFILAFVFFALSAAGPRLPLANVTHTQTSNMNIMLLVDMSASMRVTDLRPSRLRRAQIEIDDLLQRATGKRIGIIVFAARPHLLVPLTYDKQAIRFYLQSLESLVLPTLGTAVNAAVAMGISELKTAQQDDAGIPSAMLLISDGDFASTGGAQGKGAGSLETLLRAAQIPLYTLGVGSREGGAIPQLGGGWLAQEGRPIISRLNAEVLQDLADASGGKFSPITEDDGDWRLLYDAGLAQQAHPSTAPDANEHINWHELYSWPLALAGLFLFFALSPYRLSLKKATEVGASAMAAAALLLIILSYAPVHAAEGEKAGEAYEHFFSGDFPKALAAYQELEGYEGRFGEAASLYRLGRFTQAISQYSQAVLAAQTDEERAVALHNLGNSYFQAGDYTAAVDIYQDSLRYRPQYAATLHNLAFSEELKRAVYERTSRIRRREWLASTGRIAEATESQLTRQDTTISSGGMREQIAPPGPIPEMANLGGKTLEELIQRGVEHIRLASIEDADKAQQRYLPSKLDLLQARQSMEELADVQPQLWKQIFEQEEGFPAPLQEPRQLPGVAPW